MYRSNKKLTFFTSTCLKAVLVLLQNIQFELFRNIPSFFFVQRNLLKVCSRYNFLWRKKLTILLHSFQIFDIYQNYLKQVGCAFPKIFRKELKEHIHTWGKSFCTIVHYWNQWFDYLIWEILLINLSPNLANKPLMIACHIKNK